ncbi:double zinc ribbon domain-containing protein [Alkalibacillus salilacus]|uniref:RNA polymerase subunit RPABC4/transcription elongation factor Spt4 n=1 Tax=Alkalibacillus salilacus TaxID=284582 RepID=A0ABT9VH19_9BACI|nr:zinc ribbon domain-containing protein [Alkalibacillus salilacus]MDQ0160251.1 RNA polymerase subunit RPABC4/transcription elongation factor Spt4 [Alkalibacillus salilacus]
MSKEETEKARVLAEKSTLLAQLGASIYHQYRIGQLYSDELKGYATRLQKLDTVLHKLNEPFNSTTTCTCGTTVSEADVYCPSCGQALTFLQLNRQDQSCKQCDTALLQDATFCHVCGTRNREEAT